MQLRSPPIIVADASNLFDGNFAPDIADRIDSRAVLDLLDDKGVDDDYTRHLAVVALKRAAKQASES